MNIEYQRIFILHFNFLSYILFPFSGTTKFAEFTSCFFGNYGIFFGNSFISLAIHQNSSNLGLIFRGIFGEFLKKSLEIVKGETPFGGI